MRIDREAFLLAVSALAAACERADDRTRPPAHIEAEPAPDPKPPVLTPEHESLAVREAVPVPKEAPKPAVAIRPMSAAKRWLFSLGAVERQNVVALCKYRLENPCAALWATLPKPQRPAVAEEDDDTAVPEVEAPITKETYLAGLDAGQRQAANAYCGEANAGMPAPNCETPLVVAFEGQPVEFTAATGRERFAFVPGEPMSTDWPTAATPWIARDLDGDGAITSGVELFGSSTALAGGTARNGYEALAALDANGDGVIDRRDPVFAELLLWTDANGDHRSSPDELRPLSSVVTAIPLAHAIDPRCTARGACEGERGKLRWRDTHGAEREGAVIDVYLPRR